MELETLRVNDITPDSKVRPRMLPPARVLPLNLSFCMLNLIQVEAKKPETGSWGGQRKRGGMGKYR